MLRVLAVCAHTHRPCLDMPAKKRPAAAMPVKKQPAARFTQPDIIEDGLSQAWHYSSGDMYMSDPANGDYSWGFALSAQKGDEALLKYSEVKLPKNLGICFQRGVALDLASDSLEGQIATLDRQFRHSSQLYPMFGDLIPSAMDGNDCCRVQRELNQAELQSKIAGLRKELCRTCNDRYLMLDIGWHKADSRDSDTHRREMMVVLESFQAAVAEWSDQCVGTLVHVRLGTFDQEEEQEDMGSCKYSGTTMVCVTRGSPLEVLRLVLRRKFEGDIGKS